VWFAPPTIQRSRETYAEDLETKSSKSENPKKEKQRPVCEIEREGMFNMTLVHRYGIEKATYIHGPKQPTACA
jgi:hypothetical protein